jgi:hypothetical protein
MRVGRVVIRSFAPIARITNETRKGVKRMNERMKSKRPSRHLFDVTCIVGSVELDPTSDQSPVEAAFALIAKHDAEGTYQFPHGDGRTYSITVELS